MSEAKPLELAGQSLMLGAMAFRAKYAKYSNLDSDGRPCKQFVRIGNAGVHEKNRAPAQPPPQAMPPYTMEHGMPCTSAAPGSDEMVQ